MRRQTPRSYVRFTPLSDPSHAALRQAVSGQELPFAVAPMVVMLSTDQKDGSQIVNWEIATTIANGSCRTN